MSDLVKRLRGYPGKRGMEKPFHMTMDEAADRIEMLERHIEKLETALREVLSLGEWGANPLARTVIFEALETTCKPSKIPENNDE
jgi:hypothetical protein